MIDLKKLKEDREHDILESLKIIDIMVDWIKKQPNNVWSKKQARLLNSVYKSINANR